MADLADVQAKLKEINEKLKDLIDNYDKLKYPEIRNRINAITSLKYKLMEDLSPSFSLSFGSWYSYLSGIDLFLRTASDETYAFYTDDKKVKAWLKYAKEEKERLEKLLRKLNESEPKKK